MPRRLLVRRSAPRVADELRAVSALGVHATKAVTDVVQDMHFAIARDPITRGFSRLVYAQIRGITHLVGVGVDGVLAALGPLLGESSPGPKRDALLAVLNGVVGDHLADTGSPLAIPMTLHRIGGPATSKLVVLVHGSSMHAGQWTRRGHDHGAALARDFGVTPVYVQYNTGRHISTNGRELAEKLEQLVQDWPVAVEEVNLIGHSMGGLVARSACHFAHKDGFSWRAKLRRLVCLGAPHQGAPLERGGSVLHALLEVTRYSAPLARLARVRSAGVTDLRYGSVLDEDWQGRQRFALGPRSRHKLSLPRGVECYAIAGTTAQAGRKRLPGDGLVPVDSALGRHKQPERAVAFPESHRFIVLGTGHLDLLASSEVYEHLRAIHSTT